MRNVKQFPLNKIRQSAWLWILYVVGFEIVYFFRLPLDNDDDGNLITKIPQN